MTADEAKSKLDEHLREIIKWHFTEETGCPFWLDWLKESDWDPKEEIKTYEDIVWYYPDPKPAAADIKGRVAFWRGVQVTD